MFFTPEQRERITDDDFGVTMTIYTNTGKVIGVDFSFFHTDPISTIPVSTFRQIELELKEKIWFTPTAEGRKLKFIKRGWWQEIGED